MTLRGQIDSLFIAGFLTGTAVSAAAYNGVPAWAYVPAIILIGVWAGTWSSAVGRATQAARHPTVWVVTDEDDNGIIGVAHTLTGAKQLAQDDMGEGSPPLAWAASLHGRYLARAVHSGTYIGSYLLRPHQVHP